MAFVGAVRAAEISGVVKLSRSGIEYTQKGALSVGRIDTYPKTEHPLYLKAYMESLVSQRASKVANNGEYKVENIPQKKQLILIYDFGDLGSYFKKIAMIEKDIVENNVIIVPTELCKVSIDFAKDKDRMIYIISSGKEGWVKFMSNSKSEQVFNLAKGKYEVVVLTEGQNDNDVIQKMDIIVMEDKENNLKFTPKLK